MRRAAIRHEDDLDMGSCRLFLQNRPAARKRFIVEVGGEDDRRSLQVFRQEVLRESAHQGSIEPGDGTPPKSLVKRWRNRSV